MGEGLLDLEHLAALETELVSVTETPGEAGPRWLRSGVCYL